MTDNRTTELTVTDRLRELLDERGVEYETDERNAITEWSTYYGAFVFFARQREGKLLVETTVATKHSVILTPEQAIAATLGRPKAKSHPYGYERDTGAYDCTRCECGCINDISATYCNDCGGEIEIDKSAEKEYYDGYSKHTVFAKKHDDGSLEFCERRYVPEDAATLGSGTLTAEREPGVLYMRGQPGADYAAITAIEVDGQRFERVKKCELEHHDTGWVSCRECNTSWKNDRPYVYRRCPYCGAKVVG